FPIHEQRRVDPGSAPRHWRTGRLGAKEGEHRGPDRSCGNPNRTIHSADSGGTAWEASPADLDHHPGPFVSRVSSRRGPSSGLPRSGPDGVTITVFRLVLKGMLRVETEGDTIDVPAGQAILTEPGEWIRYSTPGSDGAEYLAICI